MKLSLALAASFVLAAPVLAQSPSARTDWTKPVVGVDAPVSKPSPREMTAEEVEQYVREQGLWSTRVHNLYDSALPVEVYTLDELKALPPPPAPCEPPVEKGRTDTPPKPGPCPEAPPR